MATSTVILYKDCKIVPDKNFEVDNVFRYLNTLSKITIYNFQYIKHGLDIEIKVATDSIMENYTAEELLNYKNSHRYNYISILNSSDDKAVCYFVMKAEWTAKHTIKFYLAMDTVNSFVHGVDYSLNKKSMIIREHKDRVLNSTYVKDGTTYYRRKVDFNSEGIGATQYKVSENVISELGCDYDWYLMYKAPNTFKEGDFPVAVETYLMANNRFSGKQSVLAYEWSNFVNNNYYVCGELMPNGQVGTYRVGTNQYPIRSLHVFRRVGTTFKEYEITGYFGETMTVGLQEIRSFTTPAAIEVDSETKFLYELTSTQWNRAVGLISQFSLSNFAALLYSNKQRSMTPTSTGTTNEIDDIYSVDRTNTTILKIIKLPYCPVEAVVNADNSLNYSSSLLERTVINWGTSSQPINKYYLKIKTNNLNGFQNNIVNNIDIFDKMFTTFTNLDYRNDENESKLYHSDYYTKRFVYDSFVYPFNYEYLDQSKLTNTPIDEKLNINMITTSTVNSIFMFEFDNFVMDSKAQQDYPNILTVRRNNEITLFNSEYINYIKNGYNYDKKIKDMQKLSGAFSIVAGTAQLGANIAGFSGAVKTANAIGKAASTLAGPVLAPRGQDYGTYINQLQATASMPNPLNSQGTFLAIGQMAAGVGSLANGIMSIQQAEASFNQKQEQMKMSSASVAGADDVDLMSYYTNNRAKMTEYDVSDRMKSQLKDLFYYQGYISNEQKFPSFTSRRDFNFIQAEAVIDNSMNLQPEIIDNLKERYRIGITFLHEITTRNNRWDFEQTTANNETWLPITYIDNP